MVKMVLKEEKEMMLILNPGKNNKAYSILESTIAVFISSLLLLAVLGLTKAFINSSNSIHDYAVSHIEKQNQKTDEFIKK